MLLCEASGFDVVIVETVGVGQSEVAVDAMVDVFLLLVQPGAGDELQGMKRGIAELADIVVVTKADGVLEAAARTARADYDHALRFLRRRHVEWEPRTIVTSALADLGIDEVWGAVLAHQDALAGSGGLEEKRREQARQWFWSEVTDLMLARIQDSPSSSQRATALEESVVRGEMAPPGAAALLVDGGLEVR
jgi:LAO/AO transport system kinase